MSLGANIEEKGLASARWGIEHALMGLALWCPHGLDTARIAHYRVAERVRELLKEAQETLGSPWM